MIFFARNQFELVFQGLVFFAYKSPDVSVIFLISFNVKSKKIMMNPRKITRTHIGRGLTKYHITHPNNGIN